MTSEIFCNFLHLRLAALDPLIFRVRVGYSAVRVNWSSFLRGRGWLRGRALGGRGEDVGRWWRWPGGEGGGRGGALPLPTTPGTPLAPVLEIWTKDDGTGIARMVQFTFSLSTRPG